VISSNAPSGPADWLELNREYSLKWPNITVEKEMPKDAREHRNEAGKFDKYFSPSPGEGD